MKLLFLTISLLASFASQSKDFNHAAGTGLQYSGLVGYQISTTKQQNNFRASIGLVGVGVGYDYFVNENFSMGTSLTLLFRNTASLNLNYYPKGFKQDSWRIGLDYGYMPADDHDSFFSSTKDKEVVWFSIGYQF
jgi:hypothetical protein